MYPIDNIRDSITQQRAVLVLGSGVTRAITEPNSCSTWLDLVEYGASYIENERGDRAKASIVRSILAEGLNDPDQILSACGYIVTALGGKNSTHYEEFFRSAFGDMQVEDSGSASELLSAIKAISAPIVTTNYETTLDDALGRGFSTWKEPARMKPIIRRSSSDILHLHGVWKQPDSIIFDQLDYAAIESEDVVAALRNSLGVMGSLIFVGCGAGLADPHFAALWRFLEPIRDLHGSHYVLVRNDEVGAFGTLSNTGKVHPVRYGDSYDDLAPFLLQLSAHDPTKIDAANELSILAAARGTAMEQLTESLGAEAIIRNISSGKVDNLKLDDFVVEPLLLPVPQEQFASQAFGGEEETLQPLSRDDVLRGDSTTIIVGDEQSGVTTSLQWAIYKRGEIFNDVPIYIDLLAFPSAINVETQIRKELRSLGISIDGKQPIPSVALAIDNITGLNDRALRRVVRTLSALSIARIYLGCQHGVEAAVAEIVKEELDDVLVAFIGRLGYERTLELARKVNPASAKTIAEKALSVAQKEGLPRTPLSISILIIGIASDDAWINTVSNTNFLDSFVDSLLGRGAMYDDMRSQIDSSGYSILLQRLAETLIEQDVVELMASEFLAFLEDLFESLDWSDKPQGVAKALVSKGLLLERNGRYRFKQSAFLHIFAARAARADRELLYRLKRRPLYYSAIIRHYAALVRHDEDLLRWAVEALPTVRVDDHIGSGVFSTSAASSDVTREYVKHHLRSSVDPDEENQQLSSSSEQAGVNSTSETHDPYLAMPDSEREAFPTIDYDAASDYVVLSARLRLASNILRDSELVANPELKEHALRAILEQWGIRANLYADTSELTEMMTSISAVASRSLNLSSAEAERLETELTSTWVVFDLMRALGDELATIKLSKALSRVLGKGLEENGPIVTLPGAVLSFLTADALWDDQIYRVVQKHGETQFAQNFIGRILYSYYLLTPGDSVYAKKLEGLIANYFADSESVVSAPNQKITKEQWQQGLRKGKRSFWARPSQNAIADVATDRSIADGRTTSEGGL